jgi:phage baseplate assembly protein gpV
VKRQGRRNGTLDVRRLGKALQGPNDTRHWVSWGTVASIGGDDGEPDFGDDGAVVITPASIDVDVVLEPSNQPVTCRYGHQHGKVHMLFPIRPGDQVMVIIPDGDMSMIPKIVSVESSQDREIPVEDDGKPVFRNDRALIYADGVPVDLRTAGGARVLLDGDQVNLNDGSKGVARKDDTTKLTVSQAELAELAPRILAPPGTTGGPCTAAPGPPLVFDGGEITSASGTVKAGG